MTFKHTEEKIKKIQDKTKIKAIEEHLLNLREMLLSSDFILNILEETETIYTTDIETYISKNIDYFQEVRETELKRFNIAENEEEKEKIAKNLTSLSELLSRDLWERVAQQEQLAITTFIVQIKEYNFIKSEDYINIVKYLTSDKQAIEDEEKTHDLAKRRALIIRSFEITCERILREYIEKQNENLDNKVNAYQYAINGFIDKELDKNKISALTFNMAMLTGAYYEFKHNIHEFLGLVFNYLDNFTLDDENKKRGYKELGETSEYSLTKDFSQMFLNNENRQYNVIESKLGNLEIFLSGTEESEETIENLKPFDKLVLDAIINYFRNGILDFTDVQICKEIYGTENRKQKNFTKPTEEQLKEINKSIDKLRTTNIEIIGENVSNKDEFFNSKNPFINVFNYGTRNNTSNTQYYKIISTPFYYTYNIRTGGKFIEYNKNIFTRRIAEVKKTTKNTSIRIYLLERISNIKKGLIADDETPFIDLNEIYKITDAKNSKQKYDIATITENILDDLGKEYGTKKRIKYKGKTKLGYIIEVL